MTRRNLIGAVAIGVAALVGAAGYFAIARDDDDEDERDERNQKNEAPEPKNAPAQPQNGATQ
jgi:hypothetical protein